MDSEILSTMKDQPPVLLLTQEASALDQDLQMKEPHRRSNLPILFPRTNGLTARQKFKFNPN